jgi:antirestriction protein ArdC
VDTLSTCLFPPGCCPSMKLCTKPVRSENKTPAGFPMAHDNDICRRVSRQIADALKSGSIPWRKDWVGDRNSGMPCNLGGTPYIGMNALLLQMAAAESGYRSRRWADFKTWRTLDCRLKRSSFGGTRIVLGEDSKITECNVFNAEQLEGKAVDQYLVRDNGPAKVDWQRAERLSLGTGAKISFVFGYYAAYNRPPQDDIIFPLKQQFVDGDGGLPGYYDSLFHELLHWSEPRLLWYPDSKWDEKTQYAINELRSEMGAGWLATTLGIPNSTMVANHLKYLDSWLVAIRQDTGLIFKVAQGASLGVEYLLRVGQMAA